MNVLYSVAENYGKVTESSFVLCFRDKFKIYFLKGAYHRSTRGVMAFFESRVITPVSLRWAVIAGTVSLISNFAFVQADH